MSLKRIFICVLACWLWVQPGHAQISTLFQNIGFERQSVIDVLTGTEIVYLTSGQYAETLPDCGHYCYAENGQYIIFESDRPKPAGGSLPGEKQLLAANIATGNIYWLCSILTENTGSYGQYHVSLPAAGHFDCSTQTGIGVFRNISGHSLSTLNLGNGQLHEIWHINNGTIYGSPSISRDGSKILVHVVHPGPDNGAFFAGYTSIIYQLGIDINTGQLLSGPDICYTFCWQKTDDGKIMRLSDNLINPARPDEALVLCDLVDSASQIVAAGRNLVFLKADASLAYSIFPAPKNNSIKAVWGGRGSYAYYTDNGRFVRVFVNNGQTQTWTPRIITNKIRVTPKVLSKDAAGKALSIISNAYYLDDLSVSDDEQWIAYFEHTDTGGQQRYALGLLNTFKGTYKKLLNSVSSSGPLYQNLIISIDGSKLAFIGCNGTTSRIAFVNTGN